VTKELNGISASESITAKIKAGKNNFYSLAKEPFQKQLNVSKVYTLLIRRKIIMYQTRSSKL